MNLSRRGFIRGIFAVAACVALGQKKLLVEPPAQQTFQWITEHMQGLDQKFPVGFYFARYECFAKPGLAKGDAIAMVHRDPLSLPALSERVMREWEESLPGRQRGLEAWRPV